GSSPQSTGTPPAPRVTGMRTVFANAGPAAAATNVAAIRALFMDSSLRATIARPGGVGDAAFAEEGTSPSRPQGRSCAAHSAREPALSNRPPQTDEAAPDEANHGLPCSMTNSAAASSSDRKSTRLN